MTAEAPEAIHGRVQAAFNAGDLEGLVALYEPDAQMMTPDGVAVGTEAIRENWAFLLSLGATMELTTRYAMRNEDLALLRNDYRVTGPDLDLTGSTAEVARRQPDGTWRYVIDHPFGASQLDA
ncbi:MAG: YybH family protein [Acidimicrobiales bacterium]